VPLTHINQAARRHITRRLSLRQSRKIHQDRRLPYPSTPHHFPPMIPTPSPHQTHQQPQLYQPTLSLSQYNVIPSQAVSIPITSTIPLTITTSSPHQTHQQPTYIHSLCPRPSPAYYPCSNSHPPERPQSQHHYRAYRRAKQVVFCRRSVSLPRLCQAHVIWRALPCTPFTCARSTSL
jgi:hypothetical protein